MFNFARKTIWQLFVEQKEESENLLQRMSLFVGLDPVALTRISLPLSVLAGGHYHLSGATNAGKTMTAILSLILQLIRGYRVDDNSWSKKAPIVILDLKGDEVLFHATKRAAENDGRNFKFLTTQPGAGYYFFDPFQCFSFNHLSEIDQATDTIRSLGLDSGIVYAGKYFTDHNIVLLKDALAEMRRSGGELSLSRLSAILARLASQPGKKDAGHIRLCIDMLAEYPQLNEALHRAKPSQRIDFTESLQAGDVVYFFLPCNQGGSSMRQIAALALQTVVQAAQGLRSRGMSTGPIHVFIDEFYHIASKAFGDLLSTARHWDVFFTLSNQNDSQLKAHDRDLPPIVRTNTIVKQMFSAEDVNDVRFLQEGSGQKPRFRPSYSLGPHGRTDSESEEIDWALDWNAIQRMSDSRNLSNLIVNDGVPWQVGKRVRTVRTLYPLSLHEYNWFRATPLPTTPDHALYSSGVTSVQKAEDAKPTPDSERTLNPKQEAFQKRLADLFDRLSALEAA